MDVISSIVARSAGRQLVTCAEVSHWSISSHEFQYRLYLALNRVGFTHFTTERLGFIDAILMRAWLAGTITVTLECLYRDVLLFGGIGTYLVMEHFRTSRKAFTLVGCEVDVFSGKQVKQKTVYWLKRLLSPEYAARLDFARLDRLGTPKTAVDREFARAVRVALGDERNTPRLTATVARYRCLVWRRTLTRMCRDHRMFAIGFHMARSELDGLDMKMMCLGMAARRKELTGIESSGILTRESLDRTALSCDKFRAAFRQEMAKRTWRANVIRWDKYHESSAIEKKYAGRYALVATRRLRGSISQRGAAPAAYLEGVVIPFSGDGRVVSDYDFVVFIPLSRFGAEMWK